MVELRARPCDILQTKLSFHLWDLHQWVLCPKQGQLDCDQADIIAALGGVGGPRGGRGGRHRFGFGGVGILLQIHGVCERACSRLSERAYSQAAYTPLVYTTTETRKTIRGAASLLLMMYGGSKLLLSSFGHQYRGHENGG